MSGRPASSRVNAMPSAGARAGWTPGCGCEQLWLGWWTTLRASLYRRCPPCRLHKQLQQARCLIEGGEGPGTSKGSAGANPFAGGDEAKGEGPDEDTGEDRSEGTAPGRVSTASSLLRSKSKIAERWELQEIARNRWCPEPESEPLVLQGVRWILGKIWAVLQFQEPTCRERRSSRRSSSRHRPIVGPPTASTSSRFRSEAGQGSWDGTQAFRGSRAGWASRPAS